MMRWRVWMCALALGCASSGGTLGAGDLGDPGPADMAPDRPDLVMASDPGPLEDDSSVEDRPFDPAPDVVDAEDVLRDAGCRLPPTFGKACLGNADCESGWCIHGKDGDVCTGACIECCPDGWRCLEVSIGGPDLQFACVPGHVPLCRPCKESQDCQAMGYDAGAHCDAIGVDGARFCMTPCNAVNNPCPRGYRCEEIAGAPAGGTWCVPENGECACDAVAAALGMWTECQRTNAAGTCRGRRTCSVTGLMACDAREAAEETCNEADDDCDGQTDEGYLGKETCNGKDDDCDGVTDPEGAEGCRKYYRDEDGDEYGVDVSSKCLCAASPPWSAEVAGDCEDGNPAVHPAAVETCGGKDDDCNGVVDPPGAQGCEPWFADADGDGFGNAAAWSCRCGASPSYPVSDATDCMDSDRSAYPGGVEVCDGVDDDCDGDTDEGADEVCLTDCGMGERPCAGGTIGACSALEPNDCVGYDDGCAAFTTCGTCPASPGERCNQADDDCDGEVDEGVGPQCEGKGCGDDGCGGSCGTCAAARCDGLVHHDAATCSAAGLCETGPTEPCDDKNACTDDACDPTTGCSSVPNAASCEDGDLCTIGDACAAGKCLPGVPRACTDGKPCTDDGCDAATGCTFTARTGPCDDGNACTQGDACSLGECVSGGSVSCEDDNPCTADSCDPRSGCVHAPNTIECDDEDACTVGDRCFEGKCLSGNARTCFDGNLCTDDGCDSAKGCTYTANVRACSDGSECTRNDRCQGGTCLGGPAPSCDDDEPCTTDTCDDAKGCVHLPNAQACEDGNQCTTGDRCSGGECQPGPETDCDDRKECTLDACAPATGCWHSGLNGAGCDDGNACTTDDFCADGECVGQGLQCGDGNPCTDDRCAPETGCSHPANSEPCDDHDACTTGDRCEEGTCKGGPPPVCDDQNPCTSDLCDTLEGCVHAENTQPCDDGNLCTTADTCAGTRCVGGPAPQCDDEEPCTNDTCEPAKGCLNVPNAAGCDDGDACTTADQCSGGSCEGGPVLDCNDGKVCTTDSCNALLGCVHANNVLACDDNNPCTTADTCAAGACVGGPSPNCDDARVCTTDSCDPASGCVHANNTLGCDDANLCTTGDTCTGGTCSGLPTVVCNDSNPCTTDTCDPVTGCVYTPIIPCCGNGVVDPGEQCDDANTTNWDGCNSCEIAEFVGSESTSGDQSNDLWVAAWPDGSFVVERHDLYVRRFNASGWPVGGDFKVEETNGEGMGLFPGPDGSFITCHKGQWNAVYPWCTAVSAANVLLWKVDASEGYLQKHYGAAAAGTPDGGVVMTWDIDVGSSTTRVRMNRWKPDGSSYWSGGESAHLNYLSYKNIVVRPDGRTFNFFESGDRWLMVTSVSPTGVVNNSGTFLDPYSPTSILLAALSDNSLLFASATAGGTTIQRYDSSLAKLGSPFSVSMTGEKRAIVPLTNGDYAVVFRRSEGTLVNVYVRWYSASGTQKGESRVNTVDTTAVADVAGAPLPEGGLVVVFGDKNASLDGSSGSLMVQRYNGNRTKRYR